MPERGVRTCSISGIENRLRAHVSDKGMSRERGIYLLSSRQADGSLGVEQNNLQKVEYIFLPNNISVQFRVMLYTNL